VDPLKELQAIIKKLEESVSLNKVAKMSGMNYITLRNIKFGKSKNVTDTVAQRLREFASTFTLPAADAAVMVDEATASAKKRGRPKKAAAAASAAPAKKRGRPKKAVVAVEAAPAEVAPVAKKRGRPKKAAAAKPVAVKAAPKKVAPKKEAAKKRGRKPGTVVKPTAAPATTEFTSLVMMKDLKRQIELAEARLAYLRSLEKVEAEFIAKMGGKK
jgi:hypothetical protein